MLRRVRLATLLAVVVHAAAPGGSTPDPVIIIPSFAGSVLDATLHHADAYRDCETKSSSFNLYASSEQFTLRLHCMINNMAMRDDSLSSTGCLNNRKGLVVTPRDFGGTGGVSVVNPDDVSIVQTVSLPRSNLCPFPPPQHCCTAAPHLHTFFRTFLPRCYSRP